MKNIKCKLYSKQMFFFLEMEVDTAPRNLHAKEKNNLFGVFVNRSILICCNCKLCAVEVAESCGRYRWRRNYQRRQNWLTHKSKLLLHFYDSYWLFSNHLFVLCSFLVCLVLVFVNELFKLYKNRMLNGRRFTCVQNGVRACAIAPMVEKKNKTKQFLT